MEDLRHTLRVLRGTLARKSYRIYQRTGAITDLEEAILRAQQALDITPPDHPNRAGQLSNLGGLLGDRYARTGEIADLKEAICKSQQAVDITPLDDPRRPAVLNNLANQLSNRYKYTGTMIDLEEAICIAKQVVDTTAPDHPSRAKWLNNLGAKLSQRYSCTGSMMDLEEAMRITQQAVDITPPNQPERATWLHSLGVHLYARYSCTGEIADLEEAIRITKQAVDSLPSHHGERPVFLNSLGVYLSDRYSRAGAVTDLEEAICIQQKVTEATPANHQNQVTWLNNLGATLGKRYFCTGEMAYLDKAISVAQQAVDSTPLDHPQRVRQLNNFGMQLANRYYRTGALADLEETIRMAQQAIDTIPPEHPDRPAILNNLGASLSERYSRTTAVTDLDEAIRIFRQGVDATPPDHPIRLALLNNLGSRLGDRFSHTKALPHLTEALRILHQVVDATPHDHTNRAAALNNFANQLNNLYSLTKSTFILDQSIRIAQQAIDATPPDHPERAVRFNNLGIHLSSRYSHNGDMADLEKAQKSHLAGLQSSTSAANIRVHAGRLFLSTPNVLEHPQAYATAKTIVNIIPLLTPRSLQNTDKRHLLSEAVGISSDAAAIALQTNQNPLAAIECLETGRGVIGAAVLQQHDISALEEIHPELARSFIDLRDRLDTPKLPIAEQPEMDKRGEANQQLELLLGTIRSTLGFERFLLPASEAEMLDTARYGPIVIVNVSRHRCDALIIKQSGLGSLQLPHISQALIDDYSQHPESTHTLSWLWDSIVHPILDSLGFIQYSSSNHQLPRIWWIPTGKLTKLPLHAAGHHLNGSRETALDMVVSSYASSVKAIIHDRRKQYKAPAEAKVSRVVALAMKETEGQHPLLHAGREIDTVLDVLGSNALPHKPQMYKKNVLSALDACDIFHFAGHGSTDPIEPLQSSLLLTDWKKEPLTVASLLEADLDVKAPFLAYLSACGTSQIRDEKAVDESIHMANAFQLAGFRHVIGTLWSVDDELCVDMARLTYEYLREKGVDDESVSRGLHHAMRLLRDEWLHGSHHDDCAEMRYMRAERDAQLDDDLGMKRPLWIPYVHFGV